MGLGAQATMRIAQKLYEEGHITYMRTDSVHLSDQAITAARARVVDLYGEEYLTKTPRRYKTTSKNAQEAHEAIRPAGDRMLPVDQLGLSGQEARLYDLIWKRTIATQMAEARIRITTVTLHVEDAVFRASGRSVLFPGFFRAYVEGSDDPEAALESQEATLPPLAKGEEVDCRELEAVGHETKPPARYTEATLVKALEAEGIGRPSTYASIIDTIQQRGYVFKQRKELVPTFTAFAVTKLLEDHFHDLVDLKFTANMEQELDDIAEGNLDWLNYLRHFYLGQEGLENQVREKGATEGIDPRQVSTVELSNLAAEVRIGQFGPFVAREENGERLTAGLPDDLAPADLTDALVEELLSHKSDGPKELGVDPVSGLPVLVKVGPYGPYVQLGDDNGNGSATGDAAAEENGSDAGDGNGDDSGGGETPAKGKAKSKAKGKTKAKKAKPKRVSLLEGMEPDSLDLEQALQLLSLPRTLGDHPETRQARAGRCGPLWPLHPIRRQLCEPQSARPCAGS